MRLTVGFLENQFEAIGECRRRHQFVQIMLSFGSVSIVGACPASGLRPNQSLREELMYSGIEVFEVGDGVSVGNIRTAIAGAYEIARKL